MDSRFDMSLKWDKTVSGLTPLFVFAWGGAYQGFAPFFIGGHLYERKSKIPAFRDAAARIESLGRPNRKGGALNVSHKKQIFSLCEASLIFLAPHLQNLNKIFTVKRY